MLSVIRTRGAHLSAVGHWKCTRPDRQPKSEPLPLGSLQDPERDEEEKNAVCSAARTLRLALRATGNATRLASALGVSVQQLAIWIAGEDMPPPQIFSLALALAFPKRDNAE